MKVAIQNKDGNLKVVDLNRRKAIRERCLNCVGWYPSEVRNCECTNCPLHLYRSGNGGQDAKARKRAIKDYCLWCNVGNQTAVAQCEIKNCPLFAFRKNRIDKSVKVDLTPKKDHT